MFADIGTFVVRVGIVAAIWIFVWWFVEARTKPMRILRAALLAVSLSLALALLRIVGW